jgi:hypothetical protein
MLEEAQTLQLFQFCAQHNLCDAIDKIVVGVLPGGRTVETCSWEFDFGPGPSVQQDIEEAIVEFTFVAKPGSPAIRQWGAVASGIAPLRWTYSRFGFGETALALRCYVMLSILPAMHTSILDVNEVPERPFVFC